MDHLGPRVADPLTAGEAELIESLHAMIRHPDFPCLGDRSVFRQDRATVRVYDELGSPASAAQLLEDLSRFASQVDSDDGFASFIALFLVRTSMVSDSSRNCCGSRGWPAGEVRRSPFVLMPS